MAKVTARRMRRQARRKLGDLVDDVFDTIEQLAEQARDLDDREALTSCDEALDALDATLTPDGLPTVTTIQVLPDVVSGPLTRATRRLRNHAAPADPEADAENAA